MIELFVVRVQACFDIPQALSVRELCKRQAEQLVITGKPSDPVVAVILLHAFVELIARQMLKKLSEDRSSRIHLLSSPIDSRQTTDQNGRCKSKSEKTKMATLRKYFKVLTVS
jgi:hypothetical protein